MVKTSTYYHRPDSTRLVLSSLRQIAAGRTETKCQALRLDNLVRFASTSYKSRADQQGRADQPWSLAAITARGRIMVLIGSNRHRLAQTAGAVIGETVAVLRPRGATRHHPPSNPYAQPWRWAQRRRRRRLQPQAAPAPSRGSGPGTDAEGAAT